MNMLTPEETEELARLEKLADARSSNGIAKPGYKSNLAHVQSRIAQLQKKRGDNFTAFTQ